ncbi:MAG: aminopeptidase P family protein [Spirochaetales bacterium]|nr:aminopeptidase P family protein [Spirochaetales bacterium]
MIETGNSARTGDTRQRLTDMKLDALILTIPENVLFLSGFWPMIGASILVFPANGNPVCIIPGCYEEESRQELWEAVPEYYSYGLTSSPEPFAAVSRLLKKAAGGRQWKRIGIEGSLRSAAVSWNSAEFILPDKQYTGVLEEVFPCAELIDIVPHLSRWKARKNDWEIERIRRASEISCLGLDTFERLAVPGRTGVEIAAEVEKRIMIDGTGLDGAKRVRAYAQVATGPVETAIAYRPNEISTTRRIEEGDLVLLELGVTAEGYWADRTRVRTAGKPSEQQLDIFALVLEAQTAAIRAVGPGVPAGAIDDTARSVIAKEGYAGEFPHITGHGVGFSYHEPLPVLRPDSPDTLEKGMVHSVEPGIYIPSFGGMRLEDDILVTDNGYEILGPYKKELA